jgi:hypothetical protein
MRCFTHSDVDAVAICKACGRALCHSCIAAVGRSCACKERCEGDVSAQADVLERGRTVYQKTASIYFRNGVFVVLMGLAFCILGTPVFSRGTLSSSNAVFFGLGLLFIGWGISSFVSARRFRKK